MVTAIIGGSGFLGSSLATRLRKNGKDHVIYDITGKSTRGKTEFADIENPESLVRLRGSTIINLAAVHRDDVRPLSRYD